MRGLFASCGAGAECKHPPLIDIAYSKIKITTEGHSVKVFVSGQIEEKQRIQCVFRQLEEAGYMITHDWTRTDDVGDKLKNRIEAGTRAAKDISGVVAADVYVLMSDNKNVGKGMYAELGAALALKELTGKPELYVVGPMNHLSIFYLHPSISHLENIDELIASLQDKKANSGLAFA